MQDIQTDTNVKIHECKILIVGTKFGAQARTTQNPGPKKPKTMNFVEYESKN